MEVGDIDSEDDWDMEVLSEIDQCRMLLNILDIWFSFTISVVQLFLLWGQKMSPPKKGQNIMFQFINILAK